MKNKIGFSIISIVFTGVVTIGLGQGCGEDLCSDKLTAFCQTTGGTASTSTSSGSGGPKCGDGKIAPANEDAGVAAEACDDGNTGDGDGCSSVCTVETGYMCNGEPSTCVSTCGNNTLDSGETCDDGNTSPGDGCSGACKLEECYQASIIPGDLKPVPKNAGDECGTPTDGMYCNGLGACVDHCMDNAQNEDETGVDCGSATCTGLCPGAACDPATNGANCPGGLCVDFVCCDTMCDSNCFACNLPGKVGVCTAVPNGMTDTNATMTCPVGQTCQGGGCSTKKANGLSCMLNSDCASGECVGPQGNKFCKQALGTPCTVGSECASGNCTSSVCLP